MAVGSLTALPEAQMFRHKLNADHLPGIPDDEVLAELSVGCVLWLVNSARRLQEGGGPPKSD